MEALKKQLSVRTHSTRRRKGAWSVGGGRQIWIQAWAWRQQRGLIDTLLKKRWLIRLLSQVRVTFTWASLTDSKHLREQSNSSLQATFYELKQFIKSSQEGSMIVRCKMGLSSRNMLLSPPINTFSGAYEQSTIFYTQIIHHYYI